MQRCHGHHSLLSDSRDDAVVTSYPTAATNCSVCRVFHRIKAQRSPIKALTTMYLPFQGGSSVAVLCLYSDGFIYSEPSLQRQYLFLKRCH